MYICMGQCVYGIQFKIKMVKMRRRGRRNNIYIFFGQSFWRVLPQVLKIEEKKPFETI